MPEPTGGGPPRTRAEAQRRADHIRTFREELDAAERDGGLSLTPQQRTALDAYHDGILSALARDFDIDVSRTQKQASRAMQVAGLLGGIAFGASALLLVLRVWGLVPTVGQVVMLIAASVGSLLLLEMLSRSNRLRFLTGLAALVAFACFVANVEGLARIFALEPRPEGLLAYAVFALGLAYAYRHRLLLVVGATCAVGYVATFLVRLTGAWWMDAPVRPESLLIGGLLVMTAGLLPHRSLEEFPPFYRGIGLLFACSAMLVLGRFGEGSWFAATPAAVEVTYQLMLFVVSATAIGVGITRGWAEVTLTGVLFFLLALFIKFVDWWWDWMPKYLFFFIVGATALLVLWGVRRLRSRLAAP